MLLVRVTKTGCVTIEHDACLCIAIRRRLARLLHCAARERGARRSMRRGSPSSTSRVPSATSSRSCPSPRRRLLRESVRGSGRRVVDRSMCRSRTFYLHATVLTLPRTYGISYLHYLVLTGSRTYIVLVSKPAQGCSSSTYILTSY